MMNLKVITLTRLFSTILFWLFSLQLMAQPGNLDPSFGLNGSAIIPFGNSNAYSHGSLIQPDGKLVLAGYSSNGTNYNFTLTRLLSNGNLDTSFNGNGVVISPIGALNNEAYDVALQSDGKLVVVGNISNGSSNDFAVVRYHSNGTLDSSFNNTGIATTSFGNFDDNATCVAIQSDGKIIVGGYSNNLGNNNDFAIARYHIDGSLDTSFDGDGLVKISISALSDYANSIFIQNDGKILLAGSSIIGGLDHFSLIRCLSNGSLDTSFDGDGKVFTNINSSDCVALSVVEQSDGKIILGGSVRINANNFEIAMIRYLSNGQLDVSFNSNGLVTTAIGTSANGYDIKLQNDGKILLAGYTTLLSQSEFALLRYNTDGTLDNDFGTNGIVTTAYAGPATGLALALQNDGKMILSGYVFINSKNQFIAARYLNCTPNVYSNNISLCDGDTLIVGDHYYTQAGTYTNYFTNAQNNCDSIVLSNVVILPTDTNYIFQNICAGQSLVIGNTSYTASGIYVQQIASTQNGCDSTLIIELEVNPPIGSNQTLTLCSGDSLVIGNHTYLISGSYSDTLIAFNGCDSIVNTNLTINQAIDTTINQVGNNLISGAIGLAYQWIDCLNANLPIIGANNQNYLATLNGSYAVIISDGNCVDTSDCYTVFSVGIDDLNLGNLIKIYPEPISEMLHVWVNPAFKFDMLEVYSLNGKLIYSKQFLTNTLNSIDTKNWNSGLYLIKIYDDSGRAYTQKLSLIK